MISLGAFVFAWDHEMAYYFPPPQSPTHSYDHLSQHTFPVYALSLDSALQIPYHSNKQEKARKKVNYFEQRWFLGTWYVHDFIFNIWLDMGITWYSTYDLIWAAVWLDMEAWPFISLCFVHAYHCTVHTLEALSDRYSFLIASFAVLLHWKLSIKEV